MGIHDFDENITARIEAQRNWDRARQGVLFERITSLLPTRSADLIPFEEVRDRLRLVNKTYRGLQEIPLDRILGSVGRYQDFTRTFLPRNPELRERWERVNTVTMMQGFKPIDVYQVGEAYFVLDGNHRVSVARQSGAPTIEAHVWEFPTPAGLSAQANLDEVFIKQEYAEFLERTRLDQLRPGAQIVFTAPGRYRELEIQIELYRDALEKIDEEHVSWEDAVTAWYDMVYTPAVQIIRDQGTIDLFPDRTEADLFIWTWRYRQELQQDDTQPVKVSDVAEQIAVYARRNPIARFFRAITGHDKRKSSTK